MISARPTDPSGIFIIKQLKIADSPHLFLIDKIIATLFENVTVKDMSATSRVCKKWHAISQNFTFLKSFFLTLRKKNCPKDMNSSNDLIHYIKALNALTVDKVESLQISSECTGTAPFCDHVCKIVLNMGTEKRENEGPISADKIYSLIKNIDHEKIKFCEIQNNFEHFLLLENTRWKHFLDETPEEVLSDHFWDNVK